MASIKINSGDKVYDIEDENGVVRGQIRFDASDINITQRIDAFQNNMSIWMDELSQREGDVTDDDFAKILVEYDAKLKAELNTLLDDENASDVVFGNKSCLSTYNGEFFIERFVKAFLPIIQKDAKKEAEKMAKRRDAYISQVK